MDLISVIIPAHNGEEFLPQCIESFLNQTYENFELVIVNDNSCDNTQKILENYQNEKIKIFNIKEGNAGAARNFGLKEAGGKYAIFFDCDDWANPMFLEKMHGKISSEKLDFVICASCEYSMRKKEFRRNRPSHSLELLKDKNKTGNILDFNEDWVFHLVEPWNKIYNLQFLTENKITFQEIQNCNDMTFFYKCLVYARKFGFVKEELVYIRRSVKNSITSRSSKNWKCYFEAYEESDKIIENYPGHEKIKENYFLRKRECLQYFFKKTGLKNKLPYYFRLKDELKKMSK